MHEGRGREAPGVEQRGPAVVAHHGLERQQQQRGAEQHRQRGQAEDHGVVRAGARGQEHVADDGRGRQLGQQHAVAHVLDPVGDPVVVPGQGAVQPGTQRGHQPADSARPWRHAQRGCAAVVSRSFTHPPAIGPRRAVLDARLTPGVRRLAGRLDDVRGISRLPGGSGGRAHPWDDTRAWRTRDATRSAAMVLGAWDAFIDEVATVDLDRPSRLSGWRAHEIAVHLGCWDDHTALADLIASARVRRRRAPRPRSTPSTRGSPPPTGTRPGTRCWPRSAATGRRPRGT